MLTFVIIFCSGHTLLAQKNDNKKNISDMNFDINVNNFNKIKTIHSIFHDPDIKIIEYYWKSIIEQIDMEAK